LDQKTFDELLQSYESESLDFKKTLPASADLAVLITAFYNTRGGKIVIGVDDDRCPVGVSNPQGIEAGITNIIRDRCDLDIMPRLEIVPYQERYFVVVHCPKGSKPPYFVRSYAHPFIRLGSTNREATIEETRQLYLAGGEVRFEQLPALKASMADLSKELILRYCKRREQLANFAIELSNEELLHNVGCLVAVNGDLYPTNAGILLFSERPQHFLPQSEVTVVRFKGIDVVEYLDRKDLHDPLPDLVTSAEAFIYRHIRVGRRVIGFKGVDYWEYPREAIREVIVNAVIHRDYSLSGQRIRIFIFDDRIEVYSPGLLPPGVTLEELRQLKSRSVLRNPAIVNIFHDYGGFIEKLGTGIRRMSHAMQKHHLPLPQFEELSGEFQVSLIGPGEQFMQDENSRPWTKELTSRQVQAVDLVLKKGNLTNKMYQQLAAVSRATAKRDLQGLVSKGIFQISGTGRGIYYILNPEWSPGDPL